MEANQNTTINTLLQKLFDNDYSGASLPQYDVIELQINELKLPILVSRN